MDTRLPDLHEADIIIIERDAAGIDIETISDWLKKWRAAGKKCILELDDDLFDIDGLNARTHSGKWTVTQIVASIKWLATAADAVITSTPHLKKLASEYNQHVYLLPNYLDPSLWGLQKKSFALQQQSDSKKGTIKIGYVGTATHNDDLAIIADSMKRIEAEYTDKVEIEVIGAFQKNLKSPLFGKAIPLSNNRMYPHFVKWLKSRVDWDIAVIPLEDVHFNKSKSSLKFLECSAMEIVSICSNVSTYSSIVEHNKNGLLVKNNSEDWYLAIKSLIDNPSKRKELSQAAYLNLIENHTTHTNTGSYHKILLDVQKTPKRQDVPETGYKQKNYFERYLIKRWGKYNRLWSKLINNPHYYFADSRHGWLRPLRFLFSR